MNNQTLLQLQTIFIVDINQIKEMDALVRNSATPKRVRDELIEILIFVTENLRQKTGLNAEDTAKLIGFKARYIDKLQERIYDSI